VCAVDAADVHLKGSIANLLVIVLEKLRSQAIHLVRGYSLERLMRSMSIFLHHACASTQKAATENELFCIQQPFDRHFQENYSIP